MKIKTSELTGAALDWAVAKCLGIRVYIGRYEHTMTGPCLLDADMVDMNTDGPQELKFSRDWAQGGPAIEREGGTLRSIGAAGWRYKAKYDYANDREGLTTSGPTPLIAAMRGYVASHLGDEIDVPEELLK